MGKIRNSVYGLALGDSIGYPCEFESFHGAVEAFQKLEAEPYETIVTDDTQMSLAIIEGVQNSIKNQSVVVAPVIEEAVRGRNVFERFLDSFKVNPPTHVNPELANVTDLDVEDIRNLSFIPSIGKEFVKWYRELDGLRAPGLACIQSCNELYRKNTRKGDDTELADWLIGGKSAPDSKGSGTVMRSPWVAFLNTGGLVDDENFKQFCYAQSLITHGHPTALDGAYLTSVITRELFLGKISLADVVEFSSDFVNERHMSDPESFGWIELGNMMERVRTGGLLYHAGAGSKFEIDPSEFIGDTGTADNVLGTALMVINAFPNDPLEIIHRTVISSGDSDTIGAVAGGIVGASTAENIWDGALWNLEVDYIPRLENTIEFLKGFHPQEDA